MIKKKKLKKQCDPKTLDRVTKEMAQPCFAESARKEEEEANHRLTKHASFLNT